MIAVYSKRTTAEIVADNLEEYGMYTIEDRAIADVCDGLKPVQRRTLWTLHTLRRTSKDIPLKCATVIGETLGKYHPHGDSACYGALVTMAWMRYPLAEKHGNFGDRLSLLAANPAAFRYTETRLAPIADHIFDDIRIMPLMKSFTEEHEEPPLLPVRVPLLLVNGCTGVAMGMATNIPPHNLGEVIGATLEVLENPDCTTDDLLKHIKGPDYGTGVLLSRKADLKKLYELGEGRLSFSASYKFEEGRRGTQKLVVTGFNPGFNANKLVAATEKLADAKLLVSAANDEGSLDTGTRVVIEFTDPKIVNDRVLPLLRSSVTYSFFALDGKKRPTRYNLKRLIQGFIQYRRKIEKLVLKAERVEVNKKQRTAAARVAAIRKLEQVAKILVEGKSSDQIQEKLKQVLKVDDEQVQVILDSPMRSLRRLDEKALREKIVDYNKRLRDIDEELQDIDSVVARRLKEMLKYADKRGTRLRGGKEDLDTTEASTSYYVGITEDGRVESFGEPPIKSRAMWPYVELIQTPGKFAVVSEDNIGQSISLSFIDKFDKSVAKILGLASESHECMVAIDSEGYYVAFPPDQRRTQFNVFKEPPEEIVFAGGMRTGDSLIVFVEGHDGLVVSFEDLKVTRPNVKPKKLPGIGKKKVAVVAAYVHPSDTLVIDAEGDELGEGELTSCETPYIVGEQNMVVLEAGQRFMASADEVLNQLQKNPNTPIQLTIPIASEESDG
jgi:hypothetical protein